jgi:hypothetical protein
LSRPKPSSRINGRLSHGPKTQEGKNRSKLNALRHGLCSQDAILVDQSSEEFAQLVEDYRKEFPPCNDVEAGLITALAWSRLGIQQAQAYGNHLWSQRTSQQTSGDVRQRITEAFFSLADDGTLSRMTRYEARFQRAYRRYLQAIADSHDAPATPLPSPEKTSELPNEPKFIDSLPSEPLPSPQQTRQLPNEPIFINSLPAEPLPSPQQTPQLPNEPIFTNSLPSAPLPPPQQTRQLPNEPIFTNPLSRDPPPDLNTQCMTACSTMQKFPEERAA